MRVDLVLKYLCLVKSRSSVKSLCDQDAVVVNGRVAKPSTILRVGDRVTIHFPGGALTLSLLAVPEKQLSRSTAGACYAIEDPGRE